MSHYEHVNKQQFGVSFGKDRKLLLVSCHDSAEGKHPLGKGGFERGEAKASECSENVLPGGFAEAKARVLYSVLFLP